MYNTLLCTITKIVNSKIKFTLVLFLNLIEYVQNDSVNSARNIQPLKGRKIITMRIFRFSYILTIFKRITHFS